MKHHMRNQPLDLDDGCDLIAICIDVIVYDRTLHACVYTFKPRLNCLILSLISNQIVYTHGTLRELLVYA